MELKLVEILRAKQAFEKVMNTSLPIKIAFRLSRVAGAIDPVYMEIDKQRLKLVEKYGAPSKEGVTVKKENEAKFREEFDSFLSEELVTLNIEPIKLSLLEDLKLSALEMLALKSFIQEG
jgi:hypothetical protein